MNPALHALWRPLRRALYFTHRWLGIAGCILFVLWFVSGLVMLHVRFPALTPQERIDGLQVLDLAQVRVTPAEALAQLQLATARKLVLEQSVDTPVWRVIDSRGGHHVVSASITPLGVVTPERAEAIARGFARSATARYLETSVDDQWTLPNANSFDKARPLHRVAIDDEAGTELYVSQKTGEVVRDTSAFERRWTLFGTLLHYYTYAPIRRHGDFWRQLVLWTSGLAMVSAGTGLIVGVLRVRLRRRYRGDSPTPYRGWMAWHHVLGLIGGIAILTWVFSGWFSMGPNRWLSHSTPGQAAAKFGQAGPVFTHGLASLRTLANGPASTKAVEAAWYAGSPVWVVSDAAGGRGSVDTATGLAVAVVPEDLARAAAASYHGVAADTPVLLTEPDLYWYARHVPPVLPVWRIVLHDEADTWLHVDAATGQLLSTSTSDSRLRRWLFNGLHSLDFPLFLKTPAWYLAIWVLSLAGLAVSVTGVVIGWRRLAK
ncbi:PepSY-associated TM helix domain-containing protein [Acidovorax sp. A1169]|uniref:PepSY-associated TM helix domain-containing protein n=1 Tax=Acidovorax sp. A1169 TaxID=3059524 RepID=UPI002737FFD6|nr:PepSY-associated TM helix domain-containing protein [Acidovorax sp. A1169]MDP4077580.1 PepSY-associated TM helix domain-containing protein [Acidovorax sp. A1169]